MKAWNADKTLNGFKDGIRSAQKAHDKRKEAFIKGCQMIMQELPTIDVAEVITCKKCFFRNKNTNRCMHKNGLMGKLKPYMYCFYGSYSFDQPEDDDEEDFSEFDEEINDGES